VSLEILRLATNSLEGEGAWDRFVGSSPNGTVFHLSAWKRVVEEVKLSSLLRDVRFSTVRDIIGIV
jgi:hypothetical protein